MPTEAITTDGVGTPTAHGSVAQRLLAADMNPQVLRDAATLRKDEWEELDRTVVQVASDRLVGIRDLVNAGLTYNLTNALGTLVLQHETITEMIAAQVSMDAVTRGDNDRVEYTLVNTPIPIVHHDFQITARHLAASRRMGQTIDVTQVTEATKQVSEKLEDILFNGLSAGDLLGFGSSTAQLFGYTTRTNRNTVTLSNNWSDSAATGTDILADTIAMMTACHNDHHFGPYVLYVSTTDYLKLLEDFKANSDKSIVERLAEIPQITRVQPIDKLASGTTLLVEMSRDNVDLIVGMQPTTISWETSGGMNTMFKVMAIMVPRIKIDSSNQSGVCHGTGT